jgi:sirohydrochlorin ferrochelatase
VTAVLVLALHGTRSADGRATLDDIAARVRAERPGLEVTLCFLDVLEPSLAHALSQLSGPAVVVPALLSTGVHVSSDIPAAVADYPDVQSARHLGPHPLLSQALAQRLHDAADPVPDLVALVGSGSSHAAAYAELVQAGQDLERELGAPVSVLTMADDLAGDLAGLRASATVAAVAYLLAEGHFAQKLHSAAAEAGVEIVTDPIGAHPALIELILARYDAVLGSAGRPLDFPGAAR